MASSDEVVEDFLEVDQKIPGQNFACLSFISPEKVLKDKNKFFLLNFMKYAFQSGDQTIQQKMSDSSLDYKAMDSIYEDWLYSRREQLETEFYEGNDFRTSVRGIKVRGVYETLKEANIRAKVLQKRDPSFNVFVGQVGYWLPWDPDSDKVENQEYQEQHLNDLVKNYKQNLEQRDEYFETIKNEKIKKAKADVEKMKAEMENLPDTNESEENINKLRGIMDERDKLLNEAELKSQILQKNQEEGNNDSEESNTAEEQVQESVQPLPVPQAQIENELSEEDPWMKNKQPEESQA